MNYKDCEIPYDADGIVRLWHVSGMPGAVYPTKLCAEAAARARFPHDFTRYGRVFYQEYVRADQ